MPGAGVISASIHTTLTALPPLLTQNIGIPSSNLQVLLFAACSPPQHHEKPDHYENIHFSYFHSMARKKQTKKVKPDMAISHRKFINEAIVKKKNLATATTKKSRSKHVSPGSSHKNQRVGLFKAEDMEQALTTYRQSRLPGGGPALSIRAVAELYKEKDITFGSLQKRISGEVKSMGPASGGKGRPRILPRDVEGEHCFNMDRKLDQCVFSSKNALIWFSLYLIMTDPV